VKANLFWLQDIRITTSSPPTSCSRRKIRRSSSTSALLSTTVRRLDHLPVPCPTLTVCISTALSATDRFLSSLSWGTPEYLDPLRARGKLLLPLAVLLLPTFSITGSLHDERLSDIWALGVTMYEIVVGRTPFEKTDAEEFLTRDALEIYCGLRSPRSLREMS